MMSIVVKKNSDYSDGDDAFKNFKMIEHMSGNKISVEEGIMVRLSDKFSRLFSLMDKKAQVNDESIEDTLVDIANYCLIMKIYRENNK